MRAWLIIVLIFLEVSVNAATGVKVDWKPGGSKWTEARRRHRSRRILDGFAERHAITATREQRLKDRLRRGILRSTFQDSYANRESFLRYIETTKSIMIRDNISKVDAIITEPNFGGSGQVDKYWAYIERNITSGDFTVTTDSLETSSMTGIVYDGPDLIGFEREVGVARRGVVRFERKSHEAEPDRARFLQHLESYVKDTMVRNNIDRAEAVLLVPLLPRDRIEGQKNLVDKYWAFVEKDPMTGQFSVTTDSRTTAADTGIPFQEAGDGNCIVDLTQVLAAL
jgi:hypothetical protein